MQITTKQRGLMLGALGVFLTTAMLALIFNSQKVGFTASYSISRYVGLETWSALLFGFGNVIVAALMVRYLYLVGRAWQMGWWYFVIIVIMAIGLLGLSICPLGYFGEIGVSPTDRIHEICSRGMFACMLVTAVAFGISRHSAPFTRWCCGFYALYGIICAISYLVQVPWFRALILYFEAFYIMGFMLLGWCLQKLKNERE